MYFFHYSSKHFAFITIILFMKKKQLIWVLEWRRSVHYWWSYILFSPECKELTSMLDPPLYWWGVPPVVIRCVHWTMQMWVLQTWIKAHGLAIVMGYSIPQKKPLQWCDSLPIVVAQGSTTFGSSLGWFTVMLIGQVKGGQRKTATQLPSECTADYLTAWWATCIQEKSSVNVIWNMKCIYHLHHHVHKFEISLQKSNITFHHPQPHSMFCGIYT